MRDMVRFAVISLDHWYSALPFVEAFKTATMAQLAAIVDDDPERAGPIAEAAGVELLSDYRGVLAREDVQVVACFSSTEKNAAICRAAAAAGKHIIAVKPMALDLAEADSVVDTVRRARVRYMPTEGTFRLSGLLRQVKTWLREGQIGHPLHLLLLGRASLPIRWPGESARGWWTDASRVPGGAWMDHGIYHVDAARWLLDAEVATVAGTTARLKHVDLHLEDYGVAVLTMTNGEVVIAENTWTTPRSGFQSTYQIVGTDGMILADSETDQLRLSGKASRPGEWLTVPASTARPNLPEYFAQCLLEAKPSIATEVDARANLAVCLAFYEAAAVRKPVKLR